jgi:hypothetical protein
VLEIKDLLPDVDSTILSGVLEIKDLLPDVDSTILSGVLESVVEVSIQSFNAYFSFFHAMPFNKVSTLLCSGSRIWLTRLVPICNLARLSCRRQTLWTKYTGASWRVIRNTMAGRSVSFSGKYCITSSKSVIL